MKSIYGSIGYTLLRNNDTNKNIIILADMHDTLPECMNKVNISEWFKNKFPTSKILLEEVKRDDNELKELWTDSPHTQELKNLYLENDDIINPIDIRPKLIPFSLEMLKFSPSYKTVLLSDYLKSIDKFFSCDHEFIINNIDNYRLENLKHTVLGKHFLKIKYIYKNFLLKRRDDLKKPLTQLVSQIDDLINEVNILLDNMMEWYICANIDKYKNDTIIIHTGLYHSEKVIYWLLNHYNYNLIKTDGINKLEEITRKKIEGCIHIPNDIDVLFGGLKNKNIIY